ncbi:hypothetical protein FRB94_000573, partial [Tulasnella sp. JGI-2019a]
MSASQGTELPSIHSVLGEFSEAGSYDAWDNSTHNAGGLNIIQDDDMDIDIDAPMSNTVEVSTAVIGLESSRSVESRDSVIPATRPPENTRVHGLPRLTLSSSDSHLIIIQKRVALGHYSDIYQGVYTPTKLKLAMKCPRILEDGTIQAVDVKRRYEREATTWSSLNHVNVLPFYGVVKISSAIYLVAPWVTYGDLSKFLVTRLECFAHPSLAQGSVSVLERAAFLIFDEVATVHGIASGLAYLHACGLIHGDIKAANILMTDSLVPLLGDFGLSKKDGPTDTSPGLKGCGTARWKSPGLNDGQSRTTKTDIYALGMTIVEILTGREPFYQLPSSAKVYLMVSQGHRPQFEPISRHGKNFRPLWELAAVCWQTEPEKRPTAAQVVDCAARILFMTSPCYIPMETENSVSDGDLAVMYEQLDRKHDTARNQQLRPLSPSGFSSRTGREMRDSTDVPIGRDTKNRNGTGTRSDNGNVNDGSQGLYEMCKSLVDTAAIYKKLANPRMMAHCLKSVGEVRQIQGHYDSAHTSLNGAASIYKELNDRNMMAHCLESIGDIKEIQGYYDSAYTSLGEAVSIYKAFGDQSKMARCLQSIGDIKESQGDYCDACTSLINAAIAFGEVGDRSMTAHCLRSIGDIKNTQGQYDNALILLNESYATFKALGDQDAAAHCLKSIGWACRNLGQYSNACSSLGEAVAIYKGLGDRRKITHCLKSMVKIKEIQGHYDDACTSLSEAAATYKELGDRSRMADCLKSMGQIKANQEQHNDACRLLYEAAVIYKDLDNRIRVVDCLHSIVQIKEDQGHDNNAFASLYEGYMICKELSDERMMAHYLKSMGETQKMQGLHDDAFIWL